MASKKNDELHEFRAEGSVNYYDNHQCKGTALDKGLAARLGGHSYNILSNGDRDEIYFRKLRDDTHIVDRRNRHTVHFFGSRRRKFAQDDRSLVAECIKAPSAHPRFAVADQRRTELQLAQAESPMSYSGFQDRCHQNFFTTPEKRYSISNTHYCNEAERLRRKHSATRDEWMTRRDESMHRSISAPSVALADPAGSLRHAVQMDTRKEAHQRQTESAHFAPHHTANAVMQSLEATPAGRAHEAAQAKCSVSRIENGDFSISRKNNHFSSHDKLTRSDPYFMRPRMGATNNSVKYDIISNERRWFKY